MQYAERLPNPRVMVAPIVALAIGAAAATGTYALVDGTGADVQPTRVIVADAPAQPGQGVAAKNEAASAAAIGNPVSSTTSFGKSEAATAAALGSPVSDSSSFGKDEAATAAALGNPASDSSSFGKSEAATAAALGSSAPDSSSFGKDEANTAAAVGSRP
ncbi:MAG: hypothetical protein ICV69_11280 [Thermoleophilaceae bacterium]|nr:hypothetical protein [Thermoleophilaceae bacterium]